MKMFDKLFSPVRIGGLEIKNRVVMTAMGVGLAAAGGGVNDDIIAFYEARARGGIGLIVSGLCRVMDGAGASEPCQLAARNCADVQGLGRLVDTVHKYGTRMFIQLHHPGRQGSSCLRRATRLRLGGGKPPHGRGAARTHGPGDRQYPAGVREGGVPGADGGRRRRRDARRARLPDQQLPVPVSQPARRPLRRQLLPPHSKNGFGDLLSEFNPGKFILS